MFLERIFLPAREGLMFKFVCDHLKHTVREEGLSHFRRIFSSNKWP